MKYYQHSQPNWYEKTAWKNNQVVCGIDEVGRGCLAGPVLIAAVVLTPNTSHPLLKDSKKISAKDRLTAYGWLQKNSWYSITHASNHIIDRDNIYVATKKRMIKAFYQLTRLRSVTDMQFLLTDAMPLYVHHPNLPQNFSIASFTQGESHSMSIAAASIIAKVERDRLIGTMSYDYPKYQLEKHKGYATLVHTDEIKKCGASLMHRSSFLKKIVGPLHDTRKEQRSLFG